MFLYPVQRQIAPEIAVRISSSVGVGFSSSSARLVISIPGVQNPHWRACFSWKPCWTGSSVPFTSSDSTVRISWPSHITAKVVHDLTGCPSINTTQAPQLEVSQPQCVPVRPGVSRMKCMSSWRGSTSRETASPLMEMVTCMVRPPGAAHEPPLGGRRAAAQQLLRAGDVDGGRPDRAERHTGIRDRAVLDPERGRRCRDGPVTGPALHLLVSAAGAGAEWQPDLRKHLALADGRHVRADVELVQADDAFALGPANHGPRLQRGANRRQVLRCVRLGERAADRAAVAHDWVGNHMLGVAEGREARRKQVGLQQLHMARERADAELVVRLADVGELMEIVDVDQMLRVREPELHHRQQAVTAGDDSRLGTEPLKRLDGAVDAGRTLVLE